MNRNTLNVLDIARARLTSARDVSRPSSDELSMTQSQELYQDLFQIILTGAVEAKPASLQQDISTVRSAVTLLSKAVDQGSVTEDAANEALEAVMAGFIARRMDDSFQSLTATTQERAAAFASGVNRYGQQFR